MFTTIMFNKGGIELLQQLNYYTPTSDLTHHEVSIKEDLIHHPVKTLGEAAARIEKLTGVFRKTTQVAKFLKYIGFKRLKCAQIPAKADTKKQETFLHKKMQPRLEEAKQGKRAVLFADAAHFVHGAFLGFLWCLSRVFIKSSSGRSRFNVLGAIDAISLHLFTVCNTSYINDQTFCEMLKKLRDYYEDLPITVILDNARYQKCNLVMEEALKLSIELLYLPTYSPNLNLIERLWKYVKNEILYCKYYETFGNFKKAIEDCLDDVSGQKKKSISSLLSLKFHIPKKEMKMAA